MEFVITEYKHCSLIEINGRIDSYSAPRIREALLALIRDDHLNIVVDLQKVSYISSSGILVFVNAQKHFKHQKKGEIVFSRVPELVLSGFEPAGFDKLFKFYNDAVSAVARF